MIERLKKINELPVFSVYDAEFAAYGTVLDLDTAEIVAVGEQFAWPASGSVYCPSEPRFEALAIAEKICADCFGETACQVGYCYGYNTKLNALEWHTCDEINIAVTDAVLILAKRAELDADCRLDSSICKAFLVPKGTAVEVFSDSLHYCPCQVSDSGFGMVVGLTKDTNTDLEKPHTDAKLWAKNKWLIAHGEMVELIDGGAFCGIGGKNFEIKY